MTSDETNPPPEAAASTTALLTADLDDDDYHSSEDEDFDPTAPVADTKPTSDAGDSDNEGSDDDSEDDYSEDDAEPTKNGKRSITAVEGAASPPPRKITTRAQRRLHGDAGEKDNGKKVLEEAKKQGSVDVDALWAAMNSPAPRTPAASATPTDTTEKTEEPVPKVHEEETITISRTYTFAGQSHTEHKVVPKSSQEAQVYLASLQSTTTAPTPKPLPEGAKPRRAPPKKRVSAFDAAAIARKPAAPTGAQKMNTLEKSRLDWAGFVDKEGIGEELSKHKKGENAYLDRQAFLGRVEERGEMALKEGRKKG